ncbi:MAG: PVC-type heme-binding CxxCH protein [Planctomycetota bacterium]|nr:PVC-type heme-binding CxxCH protein [Planctomycetota bacterium]
MHQARSVARLPLSPASVLAVGLSSLPLGAQEPKPTAVPVEALPVPDGLEATVWAQSPLLCNPTNIDIDQHGRVWVTEGVNYRGKHNRREEGDRVVVLLDEDGDGRADRSQLFVQEKFLLSPLGIAVFDNRVVVAQPPDMIVYTDVDRNLSFDPAIDTREVLLTGFQGRNHDHSLHSVTAGPDGLWYWNAGNCGALFTDRSDRTFRIASAYMDPKGVKGQTSDDGHVYVGGFTVRMQPDGTLAEVIGHNYRNSYEQSVTSFGDVFQNDNDDPPACRVSHVLEYGNAGFCSRDGKRAWRADQRPGQTTQVAQWRQEDPGTMPAGDVYGGGSPTGVAFYENGALGEQWRGLLLTCEPGRNVVFGYQPRPQGAGFQLDRSDWLTSNPAQKFTGSDFTGGRWDGQLHTQFRPSDIAVGPDGAIYVADWFDGRVGGHQTLDDSLSGAIYRIAPEGFTPAIADLDLDTLEGQLAALQSPAVNVRHLGFVGLRARGDAAVEPVQALLGHDNPYVAARAIWLLAQLGDRGVAIVQQLLASEDATTRLVAFRALRRIGQTLPVAATLANDPSPAIRREVATAMRDVPAADSLPILLAVARQFDGSDRTYLDALGIGATGKEGELYRELLAEAGDASAWSGPMDWMVWRLGAADSVPALLERAQNADLDREQRERAMVALAFVRDAAAAQAMVTLAEDEDSPLRPMAIWFCLHRMNNEWREFGLREQLRERGIYDPDSVVIQPVSTPPAPPNPPKLTVAEVMKLQGDSRRGERRIGLCVTCHRIGRQGVEFGPDLTLFGKTQSREAVIESILHPSKSIAHGYEGSTVETEDGNVDGIVLSRADPVIVISTGGLVQKIPRNKVKKISRMRKSLMWPMSMMGFDAQALADVAAYLASDRIR